MSPAAARLLLIDNYDSYTHNLAHLLALANRNVAPRVIRADAYPTLAALTAAEGAFDAYILSPGPGTPHNPADFPPLETALLTSAHPVLAVCLGHQALCATHGATVRRAPAGPVHGSVSVVRRAPAGHDCPLLRGLPPTFAAVRYHSLAVDPAHLSRALLPTAWTTDFDASGKQHDVLMAVRHREFPLFGVQFHPESVATEHGLKLAANFLQIAREYRRCQMVPRPLRALQSEEGRNWERKREGKLRTVVRQVHFDCAESAKLFVALYGEEPAAFWLDSSSALKSASSVSRCSSPELVTASDATREAMLDDVPRKEESNSRTGRFSLMGACDGPMSELITYDVETRRVTVRDRRGVMTEVREESVFDYLEKQLRHRYVPPHPDLPIEMNGGYIGFFGYELKSETNGAKGNRHSSQLPDAWFVFADRLLVLDHEEDSLFLVAVVGDVEQESGAIRWFDEISGGLDSCLRQARISEGSEIFEGGAAAHGLRRRPALQFVLERSRSSYLDDIQECLREIKDGESYEVCLTNRLRTVLPDDCHLDPLQIYLALRLVNPAPYAAFLRLGQDVAVCCSSPERYLHISSEGLVESKPVKGTLPRGRSLEEDEALRRQLQHSPKDRSENLMIVDLVRNDLSQTCAVGSVQVPKLMHVESYATVHQLVSTVSGSLVQPGEAVNCIRAAYPMGSMTGAPKVRTMEIIDRLEHSARGIYSGSIGYLSLSGSADLNVVIRTAIVMGREVEIGVGGAIVALSNPNDEYDEVVLKGKALMQSLAFKTNGRSDFVVLHEDSAAHRRQKERPPEWCPTKPVAEAAT